MSLKPTLAANLAEQQQAWGDPLYVWQTIQELGDNLSGKAHSFTFRVDTSRSHSDQFDYTAENSKIYDKSNNNSFILSCVPANSNPADRLRGLTFNTEGVPAGYEDVTIDFSCRNYNFTAGHRYLIKITNANLFGQIRFGAASYLNKPNVDYFTGGGLRYANGNIFDFSNNSGSCNPVAYIWNSTDPFRNGCYVWTTPKDDLYFVLSDTPYQPPASTPFLDLPWDYEGKGLSFNEAANSITSFFDHKYPLLSSGLNEPADALNLTMGYDGQAPEGRNYSNHDGYDYAKLAKVNIGDPVLAAAAGTATYVNSCGACGNMILINHGNGYQTRYLHLQKDGLITNVPRQQVQISAHQQIGKVGATGNVSPAGDAGAHIHFGVFQDKNKDGSFDDNTPDGVTDPFGWQSKDPDPWPAFIFNYGGQSRTGNKSFYLWVKKLDNLDASLTSNGGVFKTERYTLDFPQGATNQNLNLNLQSSPNIKASNSLVSIGSTIVAIAKDSLGNLVTQFQNLFTITVSFTAFDLTKYNPDTVAIYSSQDGVNWTKEATTIDWTEKTASAELNHFTNFALLAERTDTTPPTTTANLSGDKGQDNWFRSDVQVILDAKDNEGGLGVDYTMYKSDGSDWEIYSAPLTFSSEGHHKIEFYSADKDENLEDIKSVEFDIDKTAPEANIFVDQVSQDIVVEGLDQNQTNIEKLPNPNSKNKNDAIYTVSDQAGNTLRLDVRDRDRDKKDLFKLYSLQYNNDNINEQSDNRYVVLYKERKSTINLIEQRFEIKNEIRIRIKYKSEQDQSIISTKEEGQEKVKEKRDGLILLQLKTNQGNLEYSY